jgi:AcrR family transcriptional regulator
VSKEGLTYRQKAAMTKRRRSIASIIEAARALFDEKGWYDVTRDEIAHAAGVGVATIHSNFGGKQAVALAAYAPLLLPIMEQSRATTTNEKEAQAAVINFTYDLAKLLARHPALAAALHPAHRDAACDGVVVMMNGHAVVGFDQLADQFGRLIAAYWSTRSYVGTATETAEFCLSGLLSYVLKHPEKSGTWAATLLFQLL